MPLYCMYFNFIIFHLFLEMIISQRAEFYKSKTNGLIKCILWIGRLQTLRIKISEWGSPVVAVGKADRINS